MRSGAPPPRSLASTGPFQLLFRISKNLSRGGITRFGIYHGHLWPPTHPQCADSSLPCYRTVFKQYTSTLHVQSMVQSLHALCAPQTHPSLALLCSTYTYPTHLLRSLQPLSYRYESPANAQPVGRLADLAIPRSSDGVGCGDGACGK